MVIPSNNHMVIGQRVVIVLTVKANFQKEKIRSDIIVFLFSVVSFANRRIDKISSEAYGRFHAY